MNQKHIHEFKIGDVVKAHGGLFRIIKDARYSTWHLPKSGHLETAPGPSDCAIAEAVCIAGEFPGYFRPGSDWTFQGNFKGGKYTLA
jgi:hypothetical protein